MLRRRPSDSRRLFGMKLSNSICVILGVFLIAGLLLFVVQHYQNDDSVDRQLQERSERNEQDINHHVNTTEELYKATSFSRQLAEQLILAKAYVIISKEHNNLHLAWKLSSDIRKCQLLLAKAARRQEPISLEEAEPIIKSLSSLIMKAQDSHFDIATTIMTMKSHIQALEERANAATAQSVIFGQLASESLPKNLHCLKVKLTMDYLKHQPPLLHVLENSNPRFVDNNLYHFCIFSDNVLAASVVVNSTISNVDHPTQLVFHIVTNEISYGAMQTWFFTNEFRGSAIEVQKVESFSWLNSSTGSMSLLNHLRFYIPKIYPQLEKVVFLDDDVVVQKDLTSLFSLNLHGNVNGAVHTCLEPFHRYYKYLNFSNSLISSSFDPQACAWAFGMNVFDLIAWRKANVTARYHHWQEMNVDRTMWKLGTLAPGLLVFYGLTEPLDRRWHALGLGYDTNIDNRLIESSAVVHFNGNLKPWLKLGIGRYKPLWERYLNQSHPYLRYCDTS